MIAVDYTVVAQIFFFLVLWFSLSRVLFRPFLKMLEERERKTEGAREEAAAQVQEGEKLRIEYEQALAAAEQEGIALKERLLTDGRRTRDEILNRAREEAAARLQEVRETTAKELARERPSAAQEAETIARAVVEKILGRRAGDTA
jgi:F-type H+-transporting ATPase subunit b